VTCWRQLADHVTSCLAMGQPVIVHGRLRSKPYTKGDGTAAVSYEIDAVTVGHDLTRGTSMFERRDPERQERVREPDTTADDLARMVTEEADAIAAGAAAGGPPEAGSAAA
jgi:single-strand DNA-binding protein